MKAIFHRAASAELLAASNWYEDRRSGFGQQFSDAVHEAVRSIEDHPLRHPLIPHLKSQRQCRRVLVSGFPYLVVYENTTAGPKILAVAHGRRRHGYWASRR